MLSDILKARKDGQLNNISLNAPYGARCFLAVIEFDSLIESLKES